MRTLTLDEVSEVYSTCGDVIIERHRVRHRYFEEFSVGLRRFELALSDGDGEDDYWRWFLRRVKRYRFELSAAPLPFGCQVIMPHDSVAELGQRLTRCEMLYPHLAPQARGLVGMISRLVELNENPILDRLLEISALPQAANNGHRDLAVVVKEPRLIPILKDVLASLPFDHNMEIVSEAQLRGGDCYNELAVVGPSRWFTGYVFEAPRASRIHIVHYGCIRDEYRQFPAFVGSAKTQPSSSSRRHTSVVVERTDDAIPVSAQVEYVDVDDLLPSVDLSQISNRISREPGSGADLEEVEARLFQLEGRIGVFLEAEGRSAMVIDLEEEGEASVGRMAASAIEPGMFVLLRESGGGDYIVPVADKILGKHAESVRKIQRLWKERLRQAVRGRGAMAVSVEMLDRGSIRANETNVRHWMSERNIRTEDYRDFAAIMDVVGMSGDAQKCWQIMGMIDSAHRKAGRVIRKMLLKQVMNSDLSELVQLGRMRFELTETGSGSMVAYRVVAVSPTVARIPVWQVARQFELEG
jgi:hypothetical protein